MNKSNLKNIVILKNLPSNIVEEAIVILKTNKKAKKVQKVEKKKQNKGIDKTLKQSDYVLKEAELLISDYIEGIENKKNNKESREEMKIKYRRIKNYAYLTSFILLIESIYLFIR